MPRLLRACKHGEIGWIVQVCSVAWSASLREASGVLADLLAWHGVPDSTAVDVLHTLQLGLVDMIRP